MVALPRGELEHGGDVVRLEIWVIGENLSSISAGRQEIQHIFTRMRMPRRIGRPPQTFGSTVMRWIWVIAFFRAGTLSYPRGSRRLGKHGDSGAAHDRNEA